MPNLEIYQLFEKLKNDKLNSEILCRGNAMERIGLEEKYIEVVDDEGKASYGGSQNWFEGIQSCNISGQGCGLIAAVDTALYIANRRTISKREYLNIVRDYVSKRFFIRLFLHEFLFGNSKEGGYAIGILPIQMIRYLRRNLRGNGCEYSLKWNGRNGHVNMYEKMRDMLSQNIPVIWGLYSKGNSLKLYKYNKERQLFVDNYLTLDDGRLGHNTTNSHYVTATGIVEQADADRYRRMIEISSWGQRFYIDYDEYLNYVGQSQINNYCSNILLFGQK